MKIVVETIKHEEQRYDTVGDWWYDVNGDLQVRVSLLGGWREEVLVGVHEVVEALLCKDRGIDQKDVDAFDKAFNGEDEPGDSFDSPYRREHCFASAVERMLCAAFGISWELYEKFLEKL